MPSATRAWYSCSCEHFCETDNHTIIGALTVNSAADGFDAAQAQVEAWPIELDVLRRAFRQIDSVTRSRMEVYLEFNIPRMGRRIDALLLLRSDKPHLLLLEFKVNAKTFDAAAIDQVTDYALEMKNFHEASHGADIYPILVATDSRQTCPGFHLGPDGIAKTVCVGAEGIAGAIKQVVYTPGHVVPAEWAASPYKPTPTIIEAARALYNSHNVEAITRSEGSAINITQTSQSLLRIIEEAKATRRKVIAFVTGVPGAGKTLVGLNVASLKEETDDTHAVFLSGNGPLVKVLQEALARDEVSRTHVTKSAARTRVKAFIQNVHHFRDEGLKSSAPPSEHVAIFDEAQRAWTREMTSDFMRRKKGKPDFNKSEPQFLIECMDRHADWAVIVCLVGGGQEINRGEAGISAWIDAVHTQFPHWHIAVSDKLIDAEYDAGKALERIRHRPAGAGAVTELSNLHLAVSMRSFRAENVSNFVKALLDLDTQTAKADLAVLTAPKDESNPTERYPIRITRDLKAAKQWILQQARGTERPGMLASSKALRLKPFAIDMRNQTDPIHFFLEGKDDPRSSHFLEEVGSEFDVQGLELDFAIVSWDADLRLPEGSRDWSYHDFRGNKWQNVHNPQNRAYMKNAYRVLLTRARQGMVIFVPEGNYPPDDSRRSAYYDGTYAYLKSIGIRELLCATIDKGYGMPAVS
ncbi:MAG: DUF2075 domain-containing protein [Oscillospiraceae bacterium]|nr:DUF2075 domain-containing protein [Oscillospiraceae bacterium]